MTELNPRDRELAAALRQTLEQTAARPDPLLDAALAATRAQIAAKATTRHRAPWLLAGGFALAASLAVVLIMPSLGPSTNTVSPEFADAAGMPDTDLQLLEDMDMLVAMGDERHEG